MSKQAISVAEEDAEAGRELVPAEATSTRRRRTPKARPIPRISIQAFCEDAATAEVLQTATEDRRLAKSHVSVHMGGATAAVAHYHENPTPNLIIVETSAAARRRCWPSSTGWPSAATPAPRSSSSATPTTSCSIASC